MSSVILMLLAPTNSETEISSLSSHYSMFALLPKHTYMLYMKLNSATQYFPFRQTHTHTKHACTAMMINDQINYSRSTLNIWSEINPVSGAVLKICVACVAPWPKSLRHFLSRTGILYDLAYTPIIHHQYSKYKCGKVVS